MALKPQTMSWWRKLLNYPEGTHFIWWMIELQRSLTAQCVALVAFILFFRLITGTWSLSFVLIISMYLHEWGHGQIFRIAGIKYLVLLLFPMGAVAAPANKEENARSDKLSFDILCYLLHAGPAVNVVLILFGRWVQAINIHPEVTLIATDVVLMNGLLAFGNLIPVWKLDAGQIAKLIMSSLDERQDMIASVLVAILSVLMIGALVFISPFGMSIEALIVTLWGRLGWVSFLLIVAIGVIRNATTDDPKLSETEQSLTNSQVTKHLLIWMALSGITLIAYAYPLF